MREILFRGKRIDNGEWVKGWLCSSTFLNNTITTILVPCEIFGFDMVEVDPETVGQYTGLTDKNGKNIFEGDIVIVTDDDGDVEFCNGGVGNVVIESGMWYVAGNPQNSLYDLSRCYYLEVIGNIHDNPELLKGGDDNV